MRIGRSWVCLAVLAVGVANAADYKIGDRLAPSNSAALAGYKEIGWDALIPAGWDPMKEFKKLDFAKLKDSDPKAMDAMDQLKAAWNTAPVEPNMNGTRIRIPGFVVPLGSNLDNVKEFLLVPYFGACIHVPPPPANQMVHVFPKKPLRNKQIMNPVWIAGTLEVRVSSTSFGEVGYRMKADLVETYEPPPEKPAK